MQSLMNCYHHNAPSTHVCLRQDCPYRLACLKCLTSQHIGHVDSDILSLKQFHDKIFLEFQRYYFSQLRPEIDRLKRVLYKDDLIQHIQRELQYLKEKTISILKERENKLLEFIEKQYIHSHYLKDIIDHIELMRENKIYEEGIKVVLPILNQGVQDTISKFEKDKVRIVVRVKEQVNQVKTVLDGLFYIGNQYQLEQHKLKIADTLSISEREIKKNEDRLFQSAVHLTSKPKEIDPKYPYGNHQQFVDGLFPQKQIDYVQLYNMYPIQKFEHQQPFERTDNFQLYGVIEHQSPVLSTFRMRNGQILTASKVLSIFEYPSLKLIQQTAHNQNIKQVIEISPNILSLINNNSVYMYEKRSNRWVPKGEFITPGIGILGQLQILNDMFCITIQTQVIIYKLRSQIAVDQPIEYLFVNQTPTIFMHKFDCTALTFIDNGNRFYSADSAGRLYLWRTNNVYSTENVIQAANIEIIAIIPIHDGRVVTIAVDGLIKCWDQQLQTTVSVVKHKSPITAAIPFTRDIDSFFTGDSSGRIQKWKVTILIEAIYELEAHNDQISHLIFNQYLISSSFDKKVKLWMV